MPSGAVFFVYIIITKGFEQGGSEAEENSPVDCFRRRGNERSEAIGAAAPGQNPSGRAKKRSCKKTKFSHSSLIALKGIGKNAQNGQTEPKTKQKLCFWGPDGVQRYAERRSLFIA